MMQIKCEMCGSSDLVKEDSLYVCKHCGVKYSPEEAKKMMVEIEGAVKIDDTEELTNLYVLARRARDSKNYLDAEKYYGQILLKDPNNWEPAFYSLIYQSVDCQIAQLAASCDRMISGVSSVIGLVKDNVIDKEEQKRIINEMADKICWATRVFFSNARASLDLHNQYSCEKRKDTFVSAVNATYKFADELNKAFPNGEFIDAEILSTKQAVLMHGILMNEFPLTDKEKEIYIFKAQYIKKYDPSYELPKSVVVGETAVDEKDNSNLQKSEQGEVSTPKNDIKSKKSTALWIIILIAFAALAIFLVPKIIGWLSYLIFSGIGSIFGI